MAIQLTDTAIKELSVVFKHGIDGEGSEFAPRNGEARVLSIKGSEKGKIAQAFETLKAYFSSNSDLADITPYPVAQAADDIDGDGDGADDYNQIVFALCSVYGDISAAFQISDDGARSAAIVAAVQSFLLGLDALRAGDADKAGARHSAADAERLNVLAGIHKQMGEQLAALGVISSADLDPGKEADEPADGDANPGVDKAAEEPTEQVADKAEEIDMTQEQIDALVADAAAKAAEAAVAKALESAAVAKAQADADAQAKIDAANAAAEAAKVAADAATAKAAQLQDEATKAARKPSASTLTAEKASSSLQRAVRAAIANGSTSVI